MAALWIIGPKHVSVELPQCRIWKGEDVSILGPASILLFPLTLLLSLFFTL